MSCCKRRGSRSTRQASWKLTVFRDRVNSTTHGRVSIIPCDTLVSIYVNFQKIIAPPFPFFFLKDYFRLANSIVITENLIRRVHSFLKNMIDFRILYIIIISLKGNIYSKTFETRLFLVEREREREREREIGLSLFVTEYIFSWNHANIFCYRYIRIHHTDTCVFLFRKISISIGNRASTFMFKHCEPISRRNQVNCFLPIYRIYRVYRCGKNF